MKKILSLLGILVLLVGLAQDEVSQERIISIETTDGSRSGNIRYGPINYDHPEPDGVVATVSTLTIFSSNAQLRGPAEIEGEERPTLAQAQGSREATFTGGVNVERGRLTATGPDLFYSETEGLGTLTGGTEIVVAPRSESVATPIEGAEGEAGEAAEAPAEGEEAEVIGEEAEETSDEASEEVEITETEEATSEEVETEDAATEEATDEETATEEAPSDIAQGEPVFITADEADFNVDTDVSISRGNVSLVNGNQTAQAEEIEYEEERTLGVLRNEGGQVTVTRTDEDGTELTITADEIRAETDSKRLYASGNATVVDGDIVSTGDEVFFNDEEQLAEVIGNPATSVVESEGVEVTGDRLLQDIQFDFVEVIDASVASEFSADDFQLTREVAE